MFSPRRTLLAAAFLTLVVQAESSSQSEAGSVSESKPESSAADSSAPESSAADSSAPESSAADSSAPESAPASDSSAPESAPHSESMADSKAESKPDDKPYQPCDPDCTVCSSGVCTRCGHRKYVLGGRCYPCVSGCVTCFTGNSCTLCEDGKVSSGGACIWAPSSASSTGVMSAVSVLLAAVLAAMA
ncbi:hypothetical protein ADEAN_000853500 [Angomonas deanei]|uniref:Uncharacterized protein n=1 Tax=Angomonas deanei TaxID=59799 RepID=A0A7G2CMD4_9TRYP|nr:hypothetical protein ADEAN_000853500 [Angomonas deanei]